MALFSERYGYIQPSEILIRGEVPPEVVNTLCTAFDELEEELNVTYGSYPDESMQSYKDLELYVWVFFLHKRKNDIYQYGSRLRVIVPYLKSCSEWYRKLDLLEFVLEYMSKQFTDHYYEKMYNGFVSFLNSQFKVLCYGYRIVNNQVCEIISEGEIKEIEEALESCDSVRKHLEAALSLMSNRTEPDYRNSIKESISAVEYVCRDLTGENTLGKALNSLPKRGISLPDSLREGFIKLYAYTNGSSTGIRHTLMDDANVPGVDEAKFMLVACSAFVNYLKSKA